MTNEDKVKMANNPLCGYLKEYIKEAQQLRANGFIAQAQEREAIIDRLYSSSNCPPVLRELIEELEGSILL